MASAKDLVAAVRGQRAAGAEPSSVQDYWKRQHQAWLDDLTALRAQMKAWLAPVVEANVAQTKDVEFSTAEPDLGHYMAPGLDIELLADPPQIVTVRPRGLRIVGIVEAGGARVVGANGRVDLECGVRREILLRFRKNETTSWCSFGDGTRRDLGEGLFFDLLFKTAEIDRIG